MTAGNSEPVTIDPPVPDVPAPDPPAPDLPAPDATGPDVPVPDATGSPGEPGTSEVPWRRMDIRVVWVDAVIFAVSMLPGLLSVTLVNGQSRFGNWPAYIATAIGVRSSLWDLWRWYKTWYRITDERVELRTGRLIRRYRWLPRERIRSVDLTAKLRHRMARLRVVVIGSGEAQPSLELEAVSRTAAAEIRRALMRGTGTTAVNAGRPAPRETLIARLRWFWIFYNLFNIWAFIFAGLLLVGLYWTMLVFGIDLLRFVDGVVDWEALGPVRSGLVILGGLFVTGVVALAISFVKNNWRFQLVRATTDGGTVLLTRQGLLQTREVHRDDRRLRGIHVSEPLFWRWIGLAETEVISTGLAARTSGEPASSILPRTPISEVRRVAAMVFPDGYRPLEAPLRPHSRPALHRRLFWAVSVPACAAGMLAWYGVTGAIAGWAWLVAVAALPVTLVLAPIAFRALGHTVTGPYLVMRRGLNRRATAVLQRQAVAGWTVRETLVQRLLGLRTVGAITAAGARIYHLPDLAADRSAAFITEVTPDLLAEFIEVAPEPEPPPAEAPERTDG